MALGTGVGAELGVAADTHWLAFVADKLLPPKVVPTVEAVRAVCHRHSKGDSERIQGDDCGADERCSLNCVEAAELRFNETLTRYKYCHLQLRQAPRKLPV